MVITNNDNNKAKLKEHFFQVSSQVGLIRRNRNWSTYAEFIRSMAAHKTTPKIPFPLSQASFIFSFGGQSWQYRSAVTRKFQKLSRKNFIFISFNYSTRESIVYNLLLLAAQQTKLSMFIFTIFCLFVWFFSIVYSFCFLISHSLILHPCQVK